MNLDIEETLVAAFGSAPRSELVPLAGGMSGAPIFTVTIGGHSYVVRRSAGEPARVAQELRCLQLAAERGVAPAVVHADVARGVAVMEKIDGVHFGHGSMRAGLLGELARLLRRLHEGPAFPPNPPISEMTRGLDGALRAGFGAGLPAGLMTAMIELSDALAAFACSAPAHHDLNPNNLLVTESRLYLVDWELAGQGDPYLDLAQVGVFFYPRAEERDELHRAYLGRAPDERETARMYLTRALALGYYACGFHHVMARMGMLGQQLETKDAPSLGEIYAELAQARERVSPARFSGALRRAMEEMRESVRYGEAVARVAAGPASSVG